MHAPEIKCPICHAPMVPYWFQAKPEPGKWSGVFACRKCDLHWHVGGTKLFVPERQAPLCPICRQRAMNDPNCLPLKDETMTPYRNIDGRTIAWVCWNDGTFLHDRNGRAVVLPLASAVADNVLAEEENPETFEQACA